ncbi:MAG: hypothetical protein K0R55_258 [Sporomusa sp.]|nr:hypothetical protein [Sporomusa sp.]
MLKNQFTLQGLNERQMKIIKAKLKNSDETSVIPINLSGMRVNIGLSQNCSSIDLDLIRRKIRKQCFKVSSLLNPPKPCGCKLANCTER